MEEHYEFRTCFGAQIGHRSGCTGGSEQQTSVKVPAEPHNPKLCRGGRVPKSKGTLIISITVHWDLYGSSMLGFAVMKITTV